MIKNIIFDLGNVLIDFQPYSYLVSQGCSTAEADFLYEEIFRSAEWVELDRGTISAKQAIEAIKKRNPGQEILIDRFSDFMPILTQIEENTVLLDDLKSEGYRLFYLTNYHEELFSRTKEAYSFFDHFEGGVVSAHVKKIKPDPEIFTILLGKHNLIPEETLFIDDSLANAEAAEKLGMEVIHLEKPEMLKEELNSRLSAEE
ncbi:HAD family hydrolase [Spirochaeta isovalerica]|uniref:Putative hydrolase of the HAD superfamily n=1 Tax=Spirochaeta isovalerica TaxID=150 RepID=A0A841R5X5_9SPIO|nr:HAD family phosphatase [Spirochaeta isovalerica]MBB6479233.1 putative hydrolase of the HAD superfamily [Spirochaeta isovalerica]